MIDTLRRWFGVKAAELPYAPRAGAGGVSALWSAPSFDRMAREGYSLNAAVYACINEHAFAYPQPALEVVNRRGEPLPNSPLQRLIDRPNPFMAWPELALYIAVYKAIGGEVMLHKIRAGGQVVELWPYHIGQLVPISRGTDWITAYEFTTADGETVRVDRADVIHLRWPSVDPQQPWRALAPLRSVAREVDTDSEATRYLYALLKNDAAPRTIVNVKQPMTEDSYRRFVETWYARHSGDGRGGIGLVEGDASITRLSLNLQELAFDALRDVPETRIAAAFKVPPEYVGLNVGMKRSTYNNKAEARRGFIEDTIMQLCALDAGELTNELAGEFAGDLRVRHDFSRVVALQENEDAKYKRALDAYDKGIMLKNEARQYLGLKPVEELGLPELGSGNVFRDVTPVQPRIMDVTPPRAQLTTAEGEESA